MTFFYHNVINWCLLFNVMFFVSTEYQLGKAQDTNLLSECRTEDLTEDCVFPFVYKNVTYSWCTKFDTNNDKAWCAIYPTTPGGEVAYYTAEHWADCETRCQNICTKREDCLEGHFCNYDSHCQLELCIWSSDDCGLGRICKVQSWCEKLHGFERCPRECEGEETNTEPMVNMVNLGVGFKGRNGETFTVSTSKSLTNTVDATTDIIPHTIQTSTINIVQSYVSTIQEATIPAFPEFQKISTQPPSSVVETSRAMDDKAENQPIEKTEPSISAPTLDVSSLLTKK